MTNQLRGKNVAILVANGFEQSALTEPRGALTGAGASAQRVALKKEAVRAWHHKEWGEEFQADVHISSARVVDYDALLLPGGVVNPDFLRLDSRAVEFVRRFVRSGN